jgi:hypothetical protein
MPSPVREYFYFIDLRGRLWHGSSELSDPVFLQMFFRQLRPNTTGRHREYPYVSPCGNELNYVRAADTPIVFQHLRDGRLWYGGNLSVPFLPESLRFSDDGILYHPAPVGGWGRLAPALALELGNAIEPWGPYFLLSTPEHPEGSPLLPRTIPSDTRSFLVRNALLGQLSCRSFLHWLYFPGMAQAQTWLTLSRSTSAEELSVLVDALVHALLQALAVPSDARWLPRLLQSRSSIAAGTTLRLCLQLEPPPPDTVTATGSVETDEGNPLATLQYHRQSSLSP